MNSIDGDQNWVAWALYTSYKPGALFVQGATQRQARVRCLQREVRPEYLAGALQFGANFDVWDGLAKRGCYVMLRHCEGIENWYGWLRESGDPPAVEIRSPKVSRTIVRVRA